MAGSSSSPPREASKPRSHRRKLILGPYYEDEDEDETQPPKETSKISLPPKKRYREIQPEQQEPDASVTTVPEEPAGVNPKGSRNVGPPNLNSRPSAGTRGDRTGNRGRAQAPLILDQSARDQKKVDLEPAKKSKDGREGKDGSNA